MKKTRFNVRKTVTFLVIAITLFSLFSLSAFASEGEEPGRKWMLSQDFEILTDGEHSYKSVISETRTSEYMLYERFTSVHYFKNKAEVEITGESYSVVSAGEGVNLYRIYTEDSCLIYADDAQTEKLINFFNGGFGALTICSKSGKESKLTEALSDRILGLTDGEIHYVADLESLERYEVVAFDSTGSLYFYLGNIYVFADGSMKYLDYASLDNSNFDADGNLSYRKGSVRLLNIPEAVAAEIGEAKERLATPIYNYTYEEGYYNESVEFIAGGVSKMLFWIGVVLFGFCVPAIPVAIGIILPHTRKLRGKRYWYSISVAGGIWIVFAILFVLTVVI